MVLCMQCSSAGPIYVLSQRPTRALRAGSNGRRRPDIKSNQPTEYNKTQCAPGARALHPDLAAALLTQPCARAQARPVDVPRCRHAKATRPKKVSGRLALLPHARASKACGNALRRACQVWRGSKLCDFAFVTTHLLERTRCVLRARLPHARRASRGSHTPTSSPPQMIDQAASACRALHSSHRARLSVVEIARDCGRSTRRGRPRLQAPHQRIGWGGCDAGTLCGRPRAA